MKYNFYLIKNILKIYLDEILWNLRINIYLIFFGKKNKKLKILHEGISIDHFQKVPFFTNI